MRRSFLCFVTMLVCALDSAMFAAAADKPKSKSPSSSPTPSPKKKSPSSAADSTPRPSAARSGKKSESGAPAKPAPASSTDTAQSDDAAKESRAAASTGVSATLRKPDQNTAGEVATPAPTRAPAATLEPDDLREFATQPPRVQQLLAAGLELTRLNLTYTYGSADPAKGGMDCSGTMYHLLRAQGFTDVPRDSSSQYAWARKRGPFFAVVGKSADTFEFGDLLPGDLLFWTGTYETQRDIPISHVMLYLGTEKETKKRVMFGASDGRSYAGIQRWGVSVFDFKMPRESGANGSGSRVDFVGYARIPGLRGDAAVAVAPLATDAVEDESAPAPAATPAHKATTKNKSASTTPAKKTGTGKKKRE